MGSKKKGQLTTDSEWHKHLRPIGKRFFWKGERHAEKKMTSEIISEKNEMSELPLLTFNQLFSLVEENQFVNETDKRIAEKILEARRDWSISLDSLSDFIIILEKEVGGNVTETSLNKLLKKYNRNIAQYTWEAESVCYLLDIFDLTKETELRSIINKLIEKVKAE